MKRRLNWTNTLFIAGAHLMAALAIVWMAVFHFSWWTVGLGLLWFAACGLSITGGYHRLFAHPTYKAARPLRWFYLCFGAASAQNSALKWSADHRVHHAQTDQDEDPYDISRGFWWAHMGWIFWKPPVAPDYGNVPDLVADPAVRFQDRYYVAMALFFGAVVPAALGLIWGDWFGAVLTAGFLRLILQWHATFAVNSVAHTIGRQTYTTRDSARDSWITALLTLGEGYHNYHHRFQNDYRNGVRWYHFDPTKWFVWGLSKVGVTRDLRRIPDRAIREARERATAGG